MLAGKSKELIALRTLRNLDAILVRPLLDLAIRPGIEERITETLLGISRSGGSRGVGTLGVQTGKAGLTADGGDE